MNLSRRSFFAGLIACPICAASARAESAHWAYEGHGGPADWGELDKSFTACSIGTQQSPIDLAGGIKADLVDLAFDWKPQAYKIANNGHTIQANAAPGSTIGLDGARFELKQFHFHTPSEHVLNGRRSAMEVHFVHADANGQLAVVGMLMKAGNALPAFAAIMADAPSKEGEKTAAAPIDPNSFRPESRTLYRYHGSLTTPPCSEIVNWNVFTNEIEVAQADIAAFQALFPMNARPLQTMNRRFLLRNGF
jgi:carbonic anhydrase